jgi:AraC-like DNA-binding protein
VAKQRSYFWAVPDPDRRLSEAAADGLEFARQLAEDAQWRVSLLLDREPLPAPLTIGEIAEDAGLSASTVRRRIARARTELWGDLSDSGIYYRLRRRRTIARRPWRTCQEPACTNLIPRQASAARRYCETHRAPAARVRRHRRQSDQPATTPEGAN